MICRILPVSVSPCDISLEDGRKNTHNSYFSYLFACNNRQSTWKTFSFFLSFFFPSLQSHHRHFKFMLIFINIGSSYGNALCSLTLFTCIRESLKHHPRKPSWKNMGQKWKTLEEPTWSICTYTHVSSTPDNNDIHDHHNIIEKWMCLALLLNAVWHCALEILFIFFVRVLLK